MQNIPEATVISHSHSHSLVLEKLKMIIHNA